MIWLLITHDSNIKIDQLKLIVSKQLENLSIVGLSTIHNNIIY